MMDKLFKTRTGNIILSIIWGVGIAVLFYKVCENMGCFVVQKDIDNVDEMKIQEFTKCKAMYPEYKGDIVPPKCKHLFPASPTLLYMEQRRQMNCDDPKHCGKPTCYKTDPMNSIFRQ